MMELLVFGLSIQAQAQVFMGANGNISFYSKAPLEDIEAHSREMSGAIRANTRELAFSVPVNTFQFRKSLMQQHFNERYMESDKYPKATFTGKINETPDLTQPGTYPVTATGKLTIHGVPQDRTIQGTLVSDGNKLQLTSDFKVKVADHKITIPRVVFHNIAEVVDVKLDMTLNRTEE
ncbi:YceI family protein [Adhaeribacter soli]|uniref:YceI family protein n=2 Tax=Adhaeribacter soli TaxID=2607655 RepID=A0A5N1IQM5_9BACT|nr:YceI family protein [Adhaeribacter soli]